MYVADSEKGIGAGKGTRTPDPLLGKQVLHTWPLQDSRENQRTLTDGSQRATITLLDAVPHQLRTEQPKIQERFWYLLVPSLESSPRIAAGRFTIGVFGGIPVLIDGVQEVMGLPEGLCRTRRRLP
jgi:hypothetical protein